MKVFELREKSKAELVDHLNNLNKELFNLKIRRASQELPNPLRLRTIRREIARVKTLIREDEKGIKPLIQTKKPVVKPKAKKGAANA
jgi:large subunit ribosomal protein L29